MVGPQRPLLSAHSRALRSREQTLAPAVKRCGGMVASGAKDIFQLIDEQQAAETAAGLREFIDKRNSESEVIVVGAKQCGKSSLILNFVGKADAPKPTTALEYKFARYSPKEGNVQITANIWELAGDTQLAQLLDIVLVPAKLARSQVVIVADLSTPEEVVRTVRYWLDAVRARVEVCTRELRKTEEGQAALRALEEAGVPQSDGVRPIGIPVIIAGNKWDLFESQSQASTETLQVMAKTLRYVAYANGVSLVYTRERDKALVGALKRLISQYAFGAEPVQTFQTEYTKAMVVPAGKDSLTSIGFPEGMQGVTDHERLFDAWNRMFQGLFGPPSEQRSDKRDKKHVVDSEAYAEEAVDAMRAQKLKEQTQRASRLKAEAAAAAAGMAGGAATNFRT